MQRYRRGIRIFTVIYLLVVWFGTSMYGFMLLNAFLAYCPLELSFWLEDHKRSKSSIWLLVWLLWLLFFPNAPYLLTDLFHLTMVDPHLLNQGAFSASPRIWFHFFLLVSGVLCFVIAAFQSYLVVIESFCERFHWSKRKGNVLAVGLLPIISYGIYLGRVERFHSLHLFTHPIQLFQRLVHTISWEMIFFVAGFSVVLLLLLIAVNAPKLCEDR